MIIASIDIGTNTILLLICRINKTTGRVETILNEHRIPRIGKGLTPGNPISPEKSAELISILTDYKKLADAHKADKIIATATNALRIASNKDLLTDEVKRKTGIDIKVISGEEESFFSYLGASEYANPGENLLVIDIGGGSSEVITGSGLNIIYRKSFHTGVVSLTESFLTSQPPVPVQIVQLNTCIQQTFEELNDRKFIINKSIAIAGTPTTLACIKNNLEVYNEDIIEGSTLKREEISQMISELAALTPEEIKFKYKSVVTGREDVLLAGSLILFHLMNILKLEEVTVSTKGIRYGAVIAEMQK